MSQWWHGWLRVLWAAVLLWPVAALLHLTRLSLPLRDPWPILLFLLLSADTWLVVRAARNRQQILGLWFLGSAALVAAWSLGHGGHPAPAVAPALYPVVGLLVLATGQRGDGWKGSKPWAGLLAALALMAVIGGTAALSGWSLPSLLSVGSERSADVGRKPTSRTNPDRIFSLPVRTQVNSSSAPLWRVLGAPKGAYWQVGVYDHFDGRTWTSTPSPAQIVTAGEPLSPLFPPQLSGFTAHRWTVTVERLPGSQGPLIYAGTRVAILKLTGAKRITILPAAGQLLAPGASSYTLRLSVPEVDTSALAKAPSSKPPTGLSTDLQVPKDISPAVRQLARSMAKNTAGPWQVAERLASYLRTHETYTLQIGGIASDNVVNSFLLSSHRGDCNQFSTSFVVLMRTLGIPARWVVGYRPEAGDAVGQGYVLRARDAHSWAEVYVAPYGWIPVDPTPGGALADSYTTGSPAPAPVSNPEKASATKAPKAPGVNTPPATTGRKPRPLVGMVLAMLLLLAVAVAAWLWRRRLSNDANRLERRAVGLGRELLGLAQKRSGTPTGPAAMLTPRRLWEMLPEGERSALRPLVRILEETWFGDRLPSNIDLATAEELLKRAHRGMFN